MPSLWKLVLTALCVGACGVPPASSQFAPSENPIPRADLHISYQSALNQWEFVDQFAMPYERMAVLLCAAPPSSTCDLSTITFTGTCDELSAHPVFAASAWRLVGAAPDACLRAPALDASMHAVPPNKLLLDNNFAALGQFDTVERGPDSASGTNSTRSIALRVRFYIFIYICMNVYIYTYVEREKERGRERKGERESMNVQYIYIYYIYI